MTMSDKYKVETVGGRFAVVEYDNGKPVRALFFTDNKKKAEGVKEYLSLSVV